MAAAGAWLAANWFGVATVAVGAGTAIDSRERAKRAERRQDRLAQVEQAQVSENAARERRAQIRQARIQAASIENSAAASGLTQSSAAIAGVAGVNQQANMGIGDVNQTVSFNQLTSKLENDIFELRQPGTGQLVGSVLGAGLSAFTPKPTQPTQTTPTE